VTVRLKAGVIGHGIMGKKHARVLQQIGGVDLVAIVDKDPDARPDNNILFSQDINDLKNLELDYCVVSVPTEFHERVGLFLAQNGISALIEKPFSRNLEVAKRIKNEFKKYDLLAAVGYVERFNPSIMEAKRRIDNGELGQIYQIDTRRINNFPNRIKDVGVTFDLATHDIDLTLFLSRQKYNSIKSEIYKIDNREFDDLISVTATLTSGIIVNHLVNWVSPFKERKITILGEKGVFVCDTIHGDLYFYSNDSKNLYWEALEDARGLSEGSMLKFALEKKEPLVSEHESFRDFILGGVKNNLAGLDDSIEVIKVAERILQGGVIR
jgi:UDP-N-acetylglucosamine 3-dehydrogenase